MTQLLSFFLHVTCACACLCAFSFFFLLHTFCWGTVRAPPRAGGGCRTTFPSCGRCWTSSCRRSSTAWTRSTTGSTRQANTMVLVINSWPYCFLCRSGIGDDRLATGVQLCNASLVQNWVVSTSERSELLCVGHGFWVNGYTRTQDILVSLQYAAPPVKKLAFGMMLKTLLYIV